MASDTKKRGLKAFLLILVLVTLIVVACSKESAKEREIKKCSAQEDILLKDFCLANASITYNDSSICDLLSTETRTRICKTLKR